MKSIGNSVQASVYFFVHEKKAGVVTAAVGRTEEHEVAMRKAKKKARRGSAFPYFILPRS